MAFWNLKSDGVTQSLLSCFQNCERKAYYRYKLGLVNPESTLALDFGNSMHYAIENYLLGDTPKVALDKVEKELLTRNDTFNNNEISVEELFAQLEPVFRGWVEYWQMRDSKKYKWLDVEKEFNVPSPVNGISFRGKVDGVYELPKENSIGILETKTMGQINDDLIYKLSFDRQLMLYCYAINQEYLRPVTQCTYNIIRRPLLRRGKTETLDTFYNRISEDVSKRPEHYFAQYIISIKQDDIDKYIKNYKPVFMAIRKFANKPVKKEEAYVQNTNECVKTYGSCEYIGKCSGVIDLKPLAIRDTVFNELK